MKPVGINRHDAGTARKMIADGSFTATDYLNACLDRIAEREADVGAWTYLAKRRALAQAANGRRIARGGRVAWHPDCDQRHYRHA